MEDKKDIISQAEYETLSDEDKKDYVVDNFNSGMVIRKGTKFPETNFITKPVTVMTAEEPEFPLTTNKTPSKDKLAEERTKNAKEDIEQGRDYKTAKAPSQFESDLKNRKFDAKDIKGNYAYSFDELVKWRDKYKAEGDDVWKKFQEEINRRPEEQAKITAKRKAEEEAKRKAEEEAKRKAEEELKTGGSNKVTEPVLKDTKAEEEALEKKQEALDNVLDKAKTRREELDEEWDELLRKNEAELDKHKDAADLADFLPRFAIQHYLEGNFGERKSAKALGTLGYFLLDKIGASMVNASQVARGMSPTQKTALEQYNTKMMEAAINRDDKNRSKINEEKINTIIKNSDALRQAGYATEVTLGNDMASKYLSQHADQIDEQVYLKLKKQAADWYDKLSDAEKMSVDRLFLAMSTNPSDRQKGILQYQLKGYEATAQEDTARAEKAKYEQAEAKEKTKTIGRLTRAQAARAEQEIENMKKDGMLTEAQAADAWKMVDLHQKDLDWYDTKEWQNQIKGYVDTASNFIPK